MSGAHRAFPVLYVDDEPQNLLAFRYALEGRFDILTAGDGFEAVTVLEREDVAVLICDQRMPEMTGVELCRRARELKPDVVRIMMTAYADLQAALDAINQGQVLRYLTKPWRNEELVEVLQSAIEMVKLRRLVHEMEARMLRGGSPPMFEAITRQISSELQTPLAALRMNAEQVDDLLTAGLDNWEDPERAQALVGAAQRSHHDSEPPLAALADLAERLERGQRPAALPGSATAELVRVVRATARILTPIVGTDTRLQLELASAPTVRMDAAEVGQLLVNLVMNAAQAVEDRSGLVTIRVAQHATMGELTVLDNGPGIAPDQLERIFDPYVTTRDGAAGLGLAVVRHLVEQAGGSVIADNQPDGGARVTVLLPLARM